MSASTKVPTKIKAANLRLKAVSLKSGPSPAQRAWVKRLGVIEAPVVEPVDDVVAGERKNLLGGLIPGIPDIIPDAVTSRITNHD
jgi:hypothetical protein